MRWLVATALLLTLPLSGAAAQGIEQACRDAPAPQIRIEACSRIIASAIQPSASGVRRFAYNRRGVALLAQATPDSPIAFKRRLRELAIADFDQALAIDPDDVSSLFQRGLASRPDDPDAALRDYDKVLALQPSFLGGMAYNNRGVILRDQGDHAEAFADFERALRLRPENGFALRNRGYEHLLRRAAPQAALADFQAALQIGFQPAETLVARGRAYLGLNDARRALADFERSLAMRPNFRSAAHGRSLALAALGQPAAVAEGGGARPLPVTPPASDGRTATVPRLPAEPEAKEAAPTASIPTAATPTASIPTVATPTAPAPVATVSAASLPAPVVETRIAVVIGNGAYASLTKLPNPPNDARDVAEALKGMGFDVSLVLDAGRTEMENRLAAFAKAARRADVALVYYAGHGLQHDGVNYLAPVDAQISDETDLRRMITLQAVLTDLQGASGVRILVLDACRDNEAVKQIAAKLPRSRAAAMKAGLADQKAEGILIAYATQPNQVAADGAGRNSPFTTALLQHLATPKLELRTMLTRVRGAVLKATGGVQRPEVSDSLDGEFAFR